MATWGYVLDYLRANFSAVQDSGERLEMFCASAHCGAQLMIVERRKVEPFPAESWATISSPVAAADYVDVNIVLDRVGDRCVAGVVRVGDTIFLRHAVPLSSMRLHEFVVPFHLVLTAADQLVHELMPDR